MPWHFAKCGMRPSVCLPENTPASCCTKATILRQTLLPPQRLSGRLAARIRSESESPVVRAAEPFTVRLRVTNLGSVTWKARGRRFGGQVTCGLKVCTEQGEVIREDLGRTALPRDVAPGDEIQLEIGVPGVLPTGRYRFRHDMVVEGVTWFESHGSSCYEHALNIVPCQS
jgi:hypothetical protein